MKPSKTDSHAVVDVLDVLLREGAVVQADVLISVADIPLVGINLRAAVAGLTTMREYGLFENWDLEKRRTSEDRRETSGKRPAPRTSSGNGDD